MLILLLLSACGTNGTVAPPGDDPTHFDPVAHYAEVAAFAGQGSKLVGFDAHGLRADGTIDLTSPLMFSARYHFVREVPAPADAPPVGAGGSADGRYHETVDVSLWQPGQWRHVTSGNSSYDYKHLGMEKSASTSPGAPEAGLVAPACPLSTLWKGLAAQGAPAGAVAFIDYDSDGWSLYVADTTARAEFLPDCQPKLDPNNVPPPPVAAEPEASPIAVPAEQTPIHRDPP